MHLLCAVLAFVAFGGEVYILLQTRVYGDKITIAKSDSNTSCNEAATLRLYLFWLATGITAVAGLNFLIACVAVVRLNDWRENYGRNSLWKWVLLPVFVCFAGLISGILPMLLEKNSVSGTAALTILALYVQTLVWALVLAWRDVRNQE